MSGWIKIYREITRHWIWDNPSYFKAWISILLTVNHDDNKVLINGEIIECKRGQSLYSLEGWVKVFGKGWTKQKVRTFFNLLKSDAMINTEGLRKTTRLTVCNYDKYQNMQHADNTDSTRTQHGLNTDSTPNKNDKKDKNEKNEKSLELRETKFISEVYQNEIYPKEMLQKFISYWTEKNKSKTKMRFELEKTFEISRRLTTWASRDKNYNKLKKDNDGYDFTDQFVREVTRDL
ncbi:MAG: hypothetical protein GX158_12080 [Bacteroidales bacterium]|jgi:hypothetical protein|nr:hypothetical protein [Candidatus Kapabacteria bacterium]NLN31948.1 hypothetical protein [Bacteroidales bacterium]